MTSSHATSLVIIPFGNGRDPAFLADTIESVQYHFKTGPTRIAVINDSVHDLQSELDLPSDTVTIYPSRYETTGRTGETRYGALFVNTLDVIRTEQRTHSFDVTVKMDDDTLVCGDDPHLSVIDYFEENPGVGVVGAFTRRGDGSPKQEAMARKGETIRDIITFRRFFRRVRATKHFMTAWEELLLSLSLRYLDHQAAKHPRYTRGDTCTGGCYFLSKRLLKRLPTQQLIARPLAFCDDPGEDTAMALLAYALGFFVADYPSGEKRIAINWRGLPVPPTALIERNIAVVHPVKGDSNHTEWSIRTKVANALRKHE